MLLSTNMYVLNHCELEGRGGGLAVFEKVPWEVVRKALDKSLIA